MAVTVKFLADIANWVSGLGKSEAAVEDNERALEDLMEQAVELGKASGRTTDQIAEDFSKAFGVPVDRAKSAIEELGESADDTGDDVAEGISDGASTAGDSLTELGSIARDVLKGDFEGATEGAIGAIGNLTGAVPGIGLAVGAAVGVAGLAFQAMRADAEATEKRIADMYDDMLESGSQYLSSSFIQKGIGEIAGDQGKYNDALKISKQLGVDVNDVIRAQAGDIEKGNELLDDANAKRQAELDAVDKVNYSMNDRSAMIGAINRKYDDMTGAINGVVTANDSAAARFGTAQSAMSDYLLDFIANAEDATREVTEFGDTIVTLPDGKQIIIDAETGQATDDMDAIEARDFTPKTVPVKFVPDDSQIRTWAPPMKYGTVTYNTTGNKWADKIVYGNFQDLP